MPASEQDVALIKGVMESLRLLSLEARKKQPVIKEAAERATLRLRNVLARQKSLSSSVVQDCLRPLILAINYQNGEATLITIAIGALQRIILSTELTEQQLQNIVRVLRLQAEGRDKSTQLRVLQTLPLMLTDSLFRASDSLMATTLGMGFLLVNNSEIMIKNTAIGIVRQSTTTLFEHVREVHLSDINVGAVAELPPIGLSCLRLFRDLCTLSCDNKEPQLQWIQATGRFPRVLALELIADVLTSGAVMLSQWSHFRAVVADHLCPLLSRNLTSETDRRILCHTMTCVQVILGRFMKYLPEKAKVLFSLLFREIVVPPLGDTPSAASSKDAQTKQKSDGAMSRTKNFLRRAFSRTTVTEAESSKQTSSSKNSWRCVLVLEALRSLTKYPDFSAVLYQLYDRSVTATPALVPLLSKLSEFIVTIVHGVSSEQLDSAADTHQRRRALSAKYISETFIVQHHGDRKQGPKSTTTNSSGKDVLLIDPAHMALIATECVIHLISSVAATPEQIHVLPRSAGAGPHTSASPNSDPDDSDDEKIIAGRHSDPRSKSDAEKLQYELVEAMWSPALHGLAQVLRMCNEEEVVQLILKAYESLTNHCSHLGHSRARDGLLQSLFELSFPGEWRTLYPVRSRCPRQWPRHVIKLQYLQSKHVRILKTQLNIAYALGEQLPSQSWDLLLGVFQQLHLALRCHHQQISTGPFGGELTILSDALSGFFQSTSRLSTDALLRLLTAIRRLAPIQQQVYAMYDVAQDDSETDAYDRKNAGSASKDPAENERGVIEVASVDRSNVRTRMRQLAMAALGADVSPHPTRSPGDAGNGGIGAPFGGDADAVGSVPCFELVKDDWLASIVPFVVEKVVDIARSNISRMELLWRRIARGFFFAVVRGSRSDSKHDPHSTANDIFVIEQQAALLRRYIVSSVGDILVDVLNFDARNLSSQPEESSVVMYRSRMAGTLIRSFAEFVKCTEPNAGVFSHDTHDAIIASTAMATAAHDRLRKVLETSAHLLAHEAWIDVMFVLRQSTDAALVNLDRGNAERHAPEETSRLAELVSVAFKSMSLIVDDHLHALSFEALTVVGRTLGCFGAQHANVNIGITAINQMLSVVDFIKTTSQRGHAQDSTLVTKLWLGMLSEMKMLSCDDRPSIRNSALQTVSLAIQAFYAKRRNSSSGVGGHETSSVLWRACFVDCLFPTLELAQQRRDDALASATGVQGDTLGTTAQGKKIRTVVHHSRDTVAKQWNETITIALKVVVRIVKIFFGTLLDVFGSTTNSWVFQDLLPRLLSCIGKALCPKHAQMNTRRSHSAEQVVTLDVHDQEVEQVALEVLFDILDFVARNGSPSPAIEMSPHSPRQRDGANGLDDVSEGTWEVLFVAILKVMSSGMLHNSKVVHDDDEVLAASFFERLLKTYSSPPCSSFWNANHVQQLLPVCDRVVLALHSRANTRRMSRAGMAINFGRTTPSEKAYLAVLAAMSTQFVTGTREETEHVPTLTMEYFRLLTSYTECKSGNGSLESARVAPKFTQSFCVQVMDMLCESFVRLCKSSLHVSTDEGRSISQQRAEDAENAAMAAVLAVSGAKDKQPDAGVSETPSERDLVGNLLLNVCAALLSNVNGPSIAQSLEVLSLKTSKNKPVELSSLWTAGLSHVTSLLNDELSAKLARNLLPTQVKSLWVDFERTLQVLDDVQIAIQARTEAKDLDDTVVNAIVTSCQALDSTVMQSQIAQYRTKFNMALLQLCDGSMLNCAAAVDLRLIMAHCDAEGASAESTSAEGTARAGNSAFTREMDTIVPVLTRGCLDPDPSLSAKSLHCFFMFTSQRPLVPAALQGVMSYSQYILDRATGKTASQECIVGVGPLPFDLQMDFVCLKLRTLLHNLRKLTVSESDFYECFPNVTMPTTHPYGQQWHLHLLIDSLKACRACTEIDTATKWELQQTLARATMGVGLLEKENDGSVAQQEF